MKILHTILLTVLINSVIMSQNNVNIRFEVNSSGLSDSSEIFITGSHRLLGNWDAGKVKLNKTHNKHFIDLSLPKHETIEFKFTRGSWQSEALNIDGTVPKNNSLTLSFDTTLVFNIIKWGDGTQHHGFNGQITGTLKYHPKFKGTGILHRDVAVWLPPDYESDTSKQYPVLYMHDGQNLFDPATASFGVDWQADETADSLIKQGKIPPMIIVGISSTRNRMIEYTNNNTGYAYIKFVATELKPFIDRHYRTIPDREHSYTGGSSAGGLISFMLLWDYNKLFSKALCFSPAFKIERLDFVSDVEKTKTKKDIKVYIANGGKGLEKRLQPGIDEMIKVLTKKGYLKNVHYWIRLYPEAEHNEAAWAEQLPESFLRMFGK